MDTRINNMMNMVDKALGTQAPPVTRTSPATSAFQAPFKAPIHPSVAHLLGQIKVRTVRAVSHVPATELAAHRGDFAELEKAHRDLAVKKLQEVLPDVVTAESVPGAYARSYAATLVVLQDPESLEKALTEAFRAGVVHASRRIEDEVDYLLDKYE